jgi:hypothetical protein
VEHILTDARREDIWVVLSELFSDPGLGADWVASKVADVNDNILEEIYFNEVEPICGKYWVCYGLYDIYFDSNKLISDIRNMLAKNKSSIFANLHHKVHVMYSRKFSKEGWEKLAIELAEYRAAQRTEDLGPKPL